MFHHIYYVRQLLCRIFLSPIALGSHELAWMNVMPLNCPNMTFGLGGMSFMNISRRIVIKRFPQNILSWMRKKFRIQRPKHCNAQRVTLSTYKNTHTLKTMIGITPGAKTIKKNTNSTQNKSQTHRDKQYEVTSFLSTDCELSTETCSKNVYSLGTKCLTSVPVTGDLRAIDRS